MTATLTLTRTWLGMQRRPFDVLLDGAPLGTIDRRQTVEHSIAAGEHLLQLRSGRLVSPERTFTVAEGAVATFSCHGAAIWPIYFAAFVKPDLGIALHEE